MITMREATIALPVLVATLLFSCTKREEIIRVTPEGRVDMHVEFDSDSLADLTEGDAVPSAATGWAVSRWHSTEAEPIDGKDKDHYGLIAEQSFPPGADLPSSFGTDADTALSLAFPTSLTTERRPDGTYYHFSRVYLPRLHWAFLHRRSEQFIKEIEEHIGEKEQDEWTDEEWTFVVRSLVGQEVDKMRLFARAAVEDVLPEAPQDAWLRMGTALERLVEELDYGRITALVAATPNEEMAAAIEAEAAAFDAEAIERMVAVLTDAFGYRAASTKAFVDRYDWHQRYHEINEDLADDSFKITVEMPGEIVAANAGDVDGAEAEWEFDGEALRDAGPNGVELMVTSRVTH
jgi:hypothetical protein